jgi:uncharacterized protein YcfJ
MCLGSKPKPKPVKAAVVQPAPTRDEAAEVASTERRRVRDQQGVYGNIFTSVLGDSNYGSNVRASNTTVAALGA